MNKQEVLDAIRKVRENSKKRNFKQKFDLIVNLTDVDLKKPDQQVELYVPLHFDIGKKIKVCAFVGPELSASAKEVCDLSISSDNFAKYQDKKVLKKMANTYDYFIAQATVMPKIATTFGRVLGPKGKMPNPKAGCVVPPNANLKAVVAGLQRLTKVYAKTIPVIHAVVGGEDMKDDEIADNVITIYNAVLHALPKEKHNVKNVMLKLTMGKSVKIGQITEKVSEPAKTGKAVKKKQKPANDKAAAK